MEQGLLRRKEERVNFSFKRERIQVIYLLIIKDPGPGSYRSPSDFGHYDGDVYQASGAIAYMSQSTKLKSLSSTIRASKIKL